MSVRIIQDDCRNAMNEIEAGSIDLVVADPPYGETSDYERAMEAF